MVRMFVSLVRAPSISTHDPLSFLKAEMPSEPLVQVHYLYRYVATRTDSLSSSDTTAGSQKKFPLLHLFPKTMRQHWSSRMTQCSASLSQATHTHSQCGPLYLYPSLSQYFNNSISQCLSTSTSQLSIFQCLNTSTHQYRTISIYQYLDISTSQHFDRIRISTSQCLDVSTSRYLNISLSLKSQYWLTVTHRGRRKEVKSQNVELASLLKLIWAGDSYPWSRLLLFLDTISLPQS